MTGIRIPSHNPEDWFLGVIKFFDSRKDFGYIASNNCGMRLATYEQDFWVNSDCFTDSSAKVEGALVVFQWEHQSGGKRRAKNVRRFSKSLEEDCKLAVKYCGTHEVVQLKERQVNMMGLCGLPRKYLLPQLKASIISNENRNIETTLEIFKQFIGKYKTVLPPNNWRYVFSKDFDSELKSEWIQIFSILSDEEWIAVLNAYPPAVIYANDVTIDNWLKQLTPRFVDSTARDDFKYTLELLNEVQKAVYVKKWRIAAEEDFLQKLASYKQKGEIPRSIIGPFDELKKARILLAKFSDNQFESEIQDCLDSIKAAKFRAALEEFSKNQDSYRRDRLKEAFKELENPLKYVGEFTEIVSPIIQKYIDANNLVSVFSMLKYASEFNEDFSTSFLYGLKSSVEETLSNELSEAISKNSKYYFENTFENHFSQFTSLYDNEYATLLKVQYEQQIRESKSIDLLLYAADSRFEWISQEDAITLCKGIIDLWSYEDIDNLLNGYIVDDTDSRVASYIFVHAIDLIASININDSFGGNSNDIDSTSKDYSSKSIYFIERLLKLNNTETTRNRWGQYISTLNAETLLALYDRGLINILPNDVIEHVVNGLSLKDTFNSPNGWYSVPAFQNKSIEKILSNPTADIFSSIAKILVSATIDKDNIGLYIWLTELLAFNKPKDMDYYETRDWDNNFSQKLTTLRNSIPEDSPLIAVIWAVYMQTRSSQAGLAKFFSWFPPYLQIKIVKRLFSFVAQGKLKHTAKSMYNFLSSNEESLSLAVEIAFSYLIMRENDPSQSFNNSHMLQLIDGRSDHSEWIGIREFVEQCHGRWRIEYDENIKVWDNKFYNGRLLKVKNSTDLCLFIPNKMVNKSGEIQNYNNKFAKTIVDIIALNFDASAYKVQRMAEGTKYFFNESSRIEVHYLIRGFNIYCPSTEETLVYSVDENYEDYFCECRVAYQLSNREGLPFYWCGNKPCFRPWVRFHTDEEWQKYTMLDFMRILNIPVDYTNLAGKTTKHGYFINFSSFLKSFAKFYEHLKCRKCSSLLHPANITNFATQAVTEFTCTHNGCEMNGVSIYLNHCFNRSKCKSIIDSRDSKQCPNGQYICPECGGCCSTENFRNRISNLVMTGGFVSPWLENFVKSSLGHWEKSEYYCSDCGALMAMGDGFIKCPKCGKTYNEHK